MSEHLEVERRLHAIRAGDSDALEALLGDLRPVVHGYARLLCAPSHDAEDATQEAMLLLHRHLAGLEHPEALRSWVWAITRSACNRLRRRARPDVPGLVDVSEAMEDPGVTPEELAILEQQARTVRAAVASLPDHERSVVVLRDLHGLDGRSTAERLGLTVEAMKTRLHNGRKRLRGVLSASEGEAGMDPDPERDVCLQVSLYLEGELSERACDALQQRLAEDPALARECESVRRMIGLCRSLDATPDDAS